MNKSGSITTKTSIEQRNKVVAVDADGKPLGIAVVTDDDKGKTGCCLIF